MAGEATENNYVVGRGKVYFDRFADGTKNKTGQHYFGNSPEFSLNQSSEDLKHYNADEGLKELDASVSLSQDTGGSLTVDNIDEDNLALWFLGEASTLAIAAAVGETEQFTVKPDAYYQLGQSPEVPMGVGDVNNVVINGPHGTHATGTVTFAGATGGAANDTVTIDGHVITLKANGAVGAQINLGANAAGTAANLNTYVNANSATLGVTSTVAGAVVTLKAVQGGVEGNTITLAETSATAGDIVVSGATLTAGDPGVIAAQGNWEVNLTTGRLHILPGAPSIEEGDVITVTYDTADQVQSLVISKGQSIYGAMFFESTNPVGKKRDGYFPYVKITPDGDYNLKGDDWQTLTFTVEILKLTGYERVYWKYRE